MAGMLRFKDEKDFEALLKRSNVRIHRDGVTRVVDRSKPAIAPPAKTHEPSEIETLLLMQIRTVGNIPEPDLIDKPYLVGRAHRIDLGWTQWTVNGWKVGVEVQGMAHRIKSKFLADIEKRVLSQQQGWLILEVAGEHIRNGKAMEWLQDLFKRAKRSE